MKIRLGELLGVKLVKSPRKRASGKTRFAYVTKSGREIQTNPAEDGWQNYWLHPPKVDGTEEFPNVDWGEVHGVEFADLVPFEVKDETD